MLISPLLAAVLGAGISTVVATLFLKGRWLREAREAASLRDQLAQERSSRAESQAAENARQQALFENMLEGVLLLDASGRVQFTNTACRRFFDLEADVRGRTLLEAFRCMTCRRWLLKRARQVGSMARNWSWRADRKPDYFRSTQSLLLGPKGGRMGS